MSNLKDCSIEELVGKVITKIEGATQYSEVITFECADLHIYEMFHYQDCCESVTVEDISGNIEDILNLPILRAYESVNNNASGHNYNSITWTFYTIVTHKAAIVIRWCGKSNGYYSESVTFAQRISNLD